MNMGRPAARADKSALHEQVRLGYVLAMVVVVLTGGCLSPTTLRPVAIHNSENIGNYNANVAALANALTREVNLHCCLEIEAARLQVSRELVGLWKLWMGSQDANDQELADPNSPMCKYLRTQIMEAEHSRDLSSDETVLAAVAERYPLAADIVYETSGFSPLRVVMDARRLIQISHEVGKAPSPEVADEWMDKRTKLLDQYLWVRLRTELMQAYQQGVAEFVSVVLEQAQVAAAHANSVLAYAQSEPQVSTLSSALRDEQLQERVLTLVEKKQGAKCAARLGEYLGKANQVSRIIGGLNKNPG